MASESDHVPAEDGHWTIWATKQKKPRFVLKEEGKGWEALHEALEAESKSCLFVHVCVVKGGLGESVDGGVTQINRPILNWKGKNTSGMTRTKHNGKKNKALEEMTPNHGMILVQNGHTKLSKESILYCLDASNGCKEIAGDDDDDKKVMG